MPTTAENNFFQNKRTTPVAYLVAILLFFLPFVQIKCNNMPFAENTGVGLAFGTDYKVTGQMSPFQNFGNNSNAEANTSREKGKMYVLALAALLLGVAGLLISLSANRSRSSITMVVALLAALSLIIVMIQINADVKSEVREPDQVNAVSDAVRVTVDYTLWFYLSVCSFLAAAFFSYKHKQLESLPSTKPTAQIQTQNVGGEPVIPKAENEWEG
jgi:hypothetical protein